jgi:polyisoprenoid-binding protein YceI
MRSICASAPSSTVPSRQAGRSSLAACCAAAIACGLFVPTAANASDWKIVAAKSWLGFAGDTGGTKFDGRFSRWDAQISFDPAHAEQGRVAVTVDMSSAATGDKEKDQALPQAPWFDSASFPKATLTVQSFKPRGGDGFDALGTLALRGATKPIVMPVTIAVDNNTLHATGRLDLVRTDYGVGASVGANWVGLAVTASFDVTAVRSP